jgi:hypothetical protein
VSNNPPLTASPLEHLRKPTMEEVLKENCWWWVGSLNQSAPQKEKDF